MSLHIFLTWGEKRFKEISDFFASKSLRKIATKVFVKTGSIYCCWILCPERKFNLFFQQQQSLIIFFVWTKELKDRYQTGSVLKKVLRGNSTLCIHALQLVQLTVILSFAWHFLSQSRCFVNVMSHAVSSIWLLLFSNPKLPRFFGRFCREPSALSWFEKCHLAEWEVFFHSKFTHNKKLFSFLLECVFVKILRTSKTYIKVPSSTHSKIIVKNFEGNLTAQNF